MTNSVYRAGWYQLRGNALTHGAEGQQVCIMLSLKVVCIKIEVATRVEPILRSNAVFSSQFFR